ncbi:symmetrical bis(5'-nucleosyl)-tetraphosphatase [Pleionea litopenaei]|uniref:bis(5'-nucleosyl)-tetraphosphatase (symmetrical) n=1 Tax=Pleionea litopenaei TaxID=3070815 RepID=A0AA51RQI5_9GAMM|nr:symmetrical bis(5'-nucleosyl)-tetraphosphatase [Pleionea sp. HL-JVS1]WMS85740.1 symmetrical bis(5'-nucleosyl)-tetraphosphatase [Pleionea sp. HL-JVS1]
MATFAVGDIQGCFTDLLRLLEKIKFDWRKDKLWLCGDLINRGPQSLNTLRYLFEHRERIRVVLGNHDLHLLAVAHGAASLKGKDNFHDVIDHPGNGDLIEWLLDQPLARYSAKRRQLMVHAGVSPQWTLKQTLACSDTVQATLSSPGQRMVFFKHMYGNMPDQWSTKLQGIERLRYITNAFTRMRFCYSDGRLDMLSKASPSRAPTGLKPWFELPLAIEKQVQIIFGHWAALNGRLANRRFQALDTGMVWGNRLTALNLKTQRRTWVKAL